MSRFLFFMIAVFCLITADWAQVKTSSQTSLTEQAKLRKAEQVVIRAMRRFGQTLDFKDVYTEFYAGDRTIKQGEIEFIAKIFIGKKYLKEIDKKNLEKLYVKFQNLFLNWWLCAEVEGKECDNEEFKQQTFQKLNKRQRNIFKQLEETKEFKSNAEILGVLAIFNLQTLLFRKPLTSRFINEIQNKVLIDSSEILTEVPKNKPYLAKYRSLYQITAKINNDWCPFSFTVIEQKGVMKIVNITILLGD